MKIPKFLIVYLVTMWLFIMVFLFTTLTGKVCVSYNGFAVDEDSNLYLGKASCIEVLRPDGEVLRNLSSYTSRGYKFTITEDQTMKISTGDYLYQTDLLGN